MAQSAQSADLQDCDLFPESYLRQRMITSREDYYSKHTLDNTSMQNQSLLLTEMMMILGVVYEYNGRTTDASDSGAFNLLLQG